MSRRLKDWRQFDWDSSPIPTEWNAAVSPLVAVCPTSLHANTVSGCCCVRIHSRRSWILLKRLWVQFWLHTVKNFNERCRKLGKWGYLKNVAIYLHVKRTNKRHSFPMQDSPLRRLKMKQTNTGQVSGTVFYYKYTSDHYVIFIGLWAEIMCFGRRVWNFGCLAPAVFNSRQQRRCAAYPRES